LKDDEWRIYYDNWRDHSDTSIKGHAAMAQFIIGRTITGIGNGIVSETI